MDAAFSSLNAALKRESRVAVLLGTQNQVGKDTAGLFLRAEFGFVRFALADALKRIASKCLRIPREVFDDPARKEIPDPTTGASPRDHLIRIATSIREGLGDDIFIRTLERSVLRRGAPRVVVTDIREAHEVDRLVSFFTLRGFTTVFLGVRRSDGPLPLSSRMNAIVANTDNVENFRLRLYATLTDQLKEKEKTCHETRAV